MENAIKNLLSTKLILGLWTTAFATWQFASTSKSLGHWTAYLGFMASVAIGHGIARVVEKKNGGVK